MEIKVYEVTKDSSYPEGFKYSLIIIDPKSGEKVLMDNHKPKSHHYHLDETEYLYKFKGIDELFEDFVDLAHKHLGVKI